MHWVWVGERLVNLKKASQIRRTKRGFQLLFGHPSLTLRVADDDPAFVPVRRFTEGATAEPQGHDKSPGQDG